MNQITNVRVVSDPYNEIDTLPDVEEEHAHPLDTGEGKAIQKKLMEWYTAERTKQSVNRYQQALDEDFYDNLQWSEEDITELNERGQAAISFNLVKPTCNWIIGTAKRTPVDWQILPRREEDVDIAGVKTELLKWLEDVNDSVYHKSRAFEDSVKVGVGWLESGIKGDPTDEPIYDRYQSWRNIIYDSSSVEKDLSDARFIFRWKWVDEDIACAMFPERKDKIREAASKEQALQTGGMDEESEEFYYMGQLVGGNASSDYQSFGRRTYISDTSYVNYRRSRVKLIEAWYRMPVIRKMVNTGDQVIAFDQNNPEQVEKAQSGEFSVFDSIKQEVYCAVFTEGAMMVYGNSPYNHDKFPFTPIWCYRRGRDNAPYGVIRDIRDAQEDYNKRASKALFILSSKGTVMDKGAVDDLDEFAREVARPDHIIVKNPGRELKITQDNQLAEEHIRLMERDQMHIQMVGGVTDENLGRQTNATSGRAIEARQLQGSVVTAQIFDNLRYAWQLHGQKVLSLAEQFISIPKIIRIAGNKKIDWVKVNQPVQLPDGTVTFINDITATKADFVVAEQDFHNTQRQALFNSMMEWLCKLAPELSIKLIPHVLDLLDIPNKDEMIRDIREALGLPLPADDMSPEEQQAMQQQQAMDAEQAELAQESARLANDLQQANINHKNAQAAAEMADANEKSMMQEQTAQMLAQEIATLRMMLEQMAKPMQQPAMPMEQEGMMQEPPEQQVNEQEIS